MKRFILLLLSVCLILGMLSACASPDDSTKDNDNKTSQSGTKNPGKDDDTVITLPDSEGLEFTQMPNGGYRVTGLGTCTDTDIVIPSKYNNCSVVGVDNSVFMDNQTITSVVLPDGMLGIDGSTFFGCTALKSVTIPDSVFEIGNSAFNKCTSLEEIKLPDGLISIGKYAFDRCTSLESIDIPASVTSIGVSAFRECNNLSQMTVHSDNAVYFSAGNCIIETASGTLISGCKATVIPSDGTVTRIGENAFEFCKELKEITIPASVNYIGSDAFSYCSSLERVVFENPNGWVVDYLKKDVSSPETARDLLRGKYSEYVWTREG